jgi:arginase
MAAFEVLTSPYHLGERVPVELTDRPHREVSVVAAASRDAVSVVAEAVAQAVAAVTEAGDPTLLFAGDCLAPLSVVAGLQRAGVDAPVVVWFDAHGDFNTPQTSPSGYLPGMALAMLVGRGPSALIDNLGMRVVPEHDVVLVDARDLDPEEAEAVAASQLIHTDAASVAAAADQLPDAPIYVHVDVDVVDPGQMPGMAFPAPGGPPLEAVAEALVALADTGSLCAVSFGVTLQADRRDAQAAVAATNELASVLP